MKLLTIGSSPSAQIKINSECVSGIHAEILLLDNGDIFLTDKGSKNGTFVQNKQITPNMEVAIRRGDNVRFSDVFLDWTLIPTITQPDFSKVKGMFGVGTNFRNKYQISGPTVSRFHATITQMKNGQWFIKDHSKNGTTVNGQKIPSDQDYRIRAKDTIVCGGVPLPNPVPQSSSIGKVATIVACAAVFIGAICLAYFKWGKNVNPEDLIPASVLVYEQYYFTAEIIDNPYKEYLPSKFFIGQEIVVDRIAFPDEINMIKPNVCMGTAFFISRDGKLVTNKHITSPWEYHDSKTFDNIRQAMEQKRNNLIDTINLLLDIYRPDIDYKTRRAWYSRYLNSEIKISGELSYNYIGVGYAGRNYAAFDEFDRCFVIKESDDKRIDLGILQLNSKKTPDDIKIIYNIDNAVLDPKLLKPQTETYYYIGYPAGVAIGMDDSRGELQPTLHELKISKAPGEFDFSCQGETIGGASGSPIVNKKGQLIGVLWGHYSALTTSTLGVHAKYVKEMVDKIY